MTRRSPVVMVGFDAAEVTLVEELCRAGELPTLESLRLRGCFGSLESPAALFAGAVWPAFYTAMDVPWHGIYHNRVWCPETMRCEPPTADRFPARPFWEALPRDRYRIAVLDVPMLLGEPRPIDGISLSGWGTHDVMVRRSWPRSLWRRLERKFGPPRMPPELLGRQTAKMLLRLRQGLLEATEQMARIGEALLAEEAWDLFILVLGAPHRGGHYLWDLSQIEGGGCPAAAWEGLRISLKDIYRACDRALAKLLGSAPPEARVVVFALHGMGRNPGWSDRCPDILRRIQERAGAATSERPLWRSVDRLLPRPLVRRVTTRLPGSLQNYLVTLWYAGMSDVRRARCLPLSMDHAGYLRINLTGRERGGLVAPGAEYRALCHALESAFLGFRDIRSGRPIADRVFMIDQVTPPDAPHREGLPDLVITWGDVSAIDSPGVYSPEYGEIRWHPVGKLPSGRPGNHRAMGWFVAGGAGIPAGTRADGYGVVDLAPTVCQWLGAERAGPFQGRPIPDLCR